MFFQTTTDRIRTRISPQQNSVSETFTFKVLGIPVFKRTKFLFLTRCRDNV